MPMPLTMKPMPCLEKGDRLGCGVEFQSYGKDPTNLPMKVYFTKNGSVKQPHPPSIFPSPCHTLGFPRVSYAVPALLAIFRLPIPMHFISLNQDTRRHPANLQMCTPLLEGQLVLTFALMHTKLQYLGGIFLEKQFDNAVYPTGASPSPCLLPCSFHLPPTPKHPTKLVSFALCSRLQLGRRPCQDRSRPPQGLRPPG